MHIEYTCTYNSIKYVNKSSTTKKESENEWTETLWIFRFKNYRFSENCTNKQRARHHTTHDIQMHYRKSYGGEK